MEHTQLLNIDEPNVEGGRNIAAAYNKRTNKNKDDKERNNKNNRSNNNNKNNNRSKSGKIKRWSYRPINVLGHGTFGIVIHAKVIETNEDVAIKRIRYDGRLHNRELIIMQKISHCEDNTNLDNSDDDDHHEHTNTNTNATTTKTTPTTKPYTTNDTNINHEESSVHSPESALSVLSTPFFSHLGCVFDYSSRRWLLCAHPHVVQLRTFYFTNDTESGESFLHLVLSYLPTDLYQVKRHHFTSLFQKQHTTNSTSFTHFNNRQHEEKQEEEEEEKEESGQEVKDQNTCSSDSISTSKMKDMIVWCKVIIFQLARALAFLHNRHICHRDVKPANVFINPQTGRVQLGDYGSAKEIVYPLLEKNVSYICSRYYRAPELLFGALHYSYAVDLWSLGCITAELLRPRGATLFRGITTIDQLAEIVKLLGSPSLEDVYAFNPSCAEAMRRVHQSMYNTSCTANGNNKGNDKTTSMNVHVTQKLKETELENKHNTKPVKNNCVRSEELQEKQCKEEKDKERNEYEQQEERELQKSESWLNDELNKMSGSVLYDVMKIQPMTWHEVLYSCTPASGIDLVSKLLKYTPSDRLTAANVVEHTFFDDLFMQEDKENNKSEIPEETGSADTLKVDVQQIESDNTTKDATLRRIPRLPNGNVLPIEMFLLTHDEQSIYSKSLQEKMWRTALAIHAVSS